MKIRLDNELFLCETVAESKGTDGFHTDDSVYLAYDYGKPFPFVINQNKERVSLTPRAVRDLARNLLPAIEEMTKIIDKYEQFLDDKEELLKEFSKDVIQSKV